MMVTFNDAKDWRSEGPEFFEKYGAVNLLKKTVFTDKVNIDLEITTRILIKKLSEICHENSFTLNQKFVFAAPP